MAVLGLPGQAQADPLAVHRARSVLELRREAVPVIIVIWGIALAIVIPVSLAAVIYASVHR